MKKNLISKVTTLHYGKYPVQKTCDMQRNKKDWLLLRKVGDCQQKLPLRKPRYQSYQTKTLNEMFQLIELKQSMKIMPYPVAMINKEIEII